MRNLILCVLIFIGVCFGANCDPSKGINTGNPDCSVDLPYCSQSTSTPAKYICTACRPTSAQGNCDCPTSQYCSQNPKTYGQCVDFVACGNDCLPYSDVQITDSSISKTYKCADLYTDSNGNLQADNIGYCIQGECSACVYDYSNDGAAAQNLKMGSCTTGQGISNARSCTYGNTLTNQHQISWSGGRYYQNPTWVWLAIYFPLIVIIVVLQALTVLRSGGS